ncbi:HNH endonuclease signature motif containing protein [Corynebacterium cystitidis]|uniref:HNH endonuclease signature motif containing protein n=1 Tax=Corynebacterium cystitidis TaxID=35757 RepID=UPI00211F37EB|nr:HNH endonuclease signature motif containing protein [Corynebacterium cystitidis]
MNRFERFADAFGDTLGVLEDAQGLSRAELVDKLHDNDMAGVICKLSGVYFGTTRYKKQQQVARKAVAENKHSLGTLDVIERYVRRIPDGKKKNTNAWKLRKHLASIRGGLTKIRAAARTMLAAITGTTGTKPARTQASVSNPADRLDRTIHLTGPEAAIAEIWETARDHATTTGLSVAESLLELFNSGGERTRYTPMVIVSLDDLATLYGTTATTAKDITPDTSDKDIILSATNGARITGQEFLDLQLTEHGFFMLTSRVSGPVDLYRTDRFFSQKQRIMAKACDPVCAIPGCGQPAERCEPNHNIAWSAGGNTNVSNVSMLCRYHNGKVDDNRSEKRFGYVDNINGQSMYFNAFGAAPQLNDHPTARGGALRIV